MYSEYKYMNFPDDPNVYERYMTGSIEGNVEKLSTLILDLISKVG